MKQLDNLPANRPTPLGCPLMFFASAAWHRGGRISPGFVAGGFPLPVYCDGTLVAHEGESRLPSVAGMLPREDGGEEMEDGSFVTVMAASTSLGGPMVARVLLKPGAVRQIGSHSSRIVFQAMRGTGKAIQGEHEIDLTAPMGVEFDADEPHSLEAGNDGLDLLAYLSGAEDGGDDCLDVWRRSFLSAELDPEPQPELQPEPEAKPEPKQAPKTTRRTAKAKQAEAEQAAS